MALGVVALLLAAGVGVRAVRGTPAPAAWEGTRAEASATELRAEVADSLVRARHRRMPLAEGERLDPNTASVDDLVRLPRVGPALAARIVERRETRGPYRTLADIDSVPGVGPVLLAAITPHLTLPPPAPAPPPAPSAGTLPLARPAAPVAAAPAGAVVDLNAAGVDELVRLPGIGPALAGRIVEHRAANGPFRSVDELQRVPGIGAAKLERIRPLVRASP
jgi:competence ComEA-like helix-hairpin-helix protein